jgi:hypothetical protein
VVLDDNGARNPTVRLQSGIFSDTRTGDGGFQKAMVKLIYRDAGQRKGQADGETNLALRRDRD